MTRPQLGVISRALLIVAILSAVLFLPYLVPAPLSISRSYIAGFNNRLCLLLFLAGSALLAVVTRGRMAVTEQIDSDLNWKAIPLAFVIFGVSVFYHGKPEITGDAFYLMNRAQMLAGGLVPYRQFEFAYGVLLLYPVVGLQRGLHLSPSAAYFAAWLLYWCVGIVMMWFVVRGLSMPIRWRKSFFALLLLLQIFAMRPINGYSYSPIRSYSAAFVVVATYEVWKRYQSSWLVVLTGLAASAFALATSMDQGVAATIGILTLVTLLIFFGEKKLSLVAFAGTFFGSAALYALVAQAGWLKPLQTFGGGGYAYPLLPSPSILLVLFTYLVAACIFYRVAVRVFASKKKENEESTASEATDLIVIPLLAAGCALLPAALGRCDVLHITAATPAFIVGAAAIFSMPGVRRWWIPLAIVGLVLLPRCVGFLELHLHLNTVDREAPLVHVAGYSTHQLPDDQWYVSQYPGVTEDQLPCDQHYFAPAFMPMPTTLFQPQCVDTGYFLGFVNNNTPRTIQAKVEELRQHATQPLLLENIPLEYQIPQQLAGTATLYGESISPWVPRIRHPALTYAPVIDYIRAHYVEGPLIANDRFQIWYPIAGPRARPR